MAQSYVDLQNSALSDDFEPSRWRPEAKQALLDALGEISRNIRLPANEATQTITTVAGTQDYTVPAGSVRVLSVIDTQTDDPLTDITRSVLDDQPDSRGRPISFALYAGSVSLYPTPDQAYSLTLRYLRQGAIPVNDTDLMAATTGIPEDYLDTLVSYARHRLFRKQDDWEAANYWEGQYRQGLQRLKADAQRRDVSAKRQVPSMWAGSPSPRFARP